MKSISRIQAGIPRPLVFTRLLISDLLLYWDLLSASQDLFNVLGV